MKKIGMFFVTAFLTIGLATSVFAAPGNPGMQRHDNWNRYERPVQPHYQTVHRDHRDFRNHSRPYRRPVIVDRRVIIPVREPVRVYEHYAPGFSLYLPGFSIQIR